MYGSSGDETTTRRVHFLDQDLESSIAWTKLTVPQQSNSYLRRSRLIDAIYGVIDRKLILVRAPAGYGKTSLLVDMACEADLQVCWYTLDSENSDLTVFLNYLVASIARRFPSFGYRSAQLLKHLGGEVHTHLRVFVTTLVDEMLNTVPEYFYLILDDYHTIEESCLVHEFIRLLIEFMPEQCHLIISSRAVPPLPLIRLVARQQMAAIGVDELRFTEQEIQQLVQEKLGTAVSLDQAQFLLQQTDGWITAILLSADAGWDSLVGSSIPSVAGLTEVGIYDYLMDEVFGYQTEETKRFLLHTAVLSEMTSSLCRELVGGDCTGILQRLERQSLFISRVEETDVETTYRYHPLFRDFLLSRLRAQPESLYQHVNARAAEFLVGRQNWSVAILHYLSAGHFAQVKQIILSHFDTLRLAGNRESLARWIDALPPEHSSLDLQLKRASLAADLGQIDTALRLYANAIVVYQSQGHTTGLAFALIERSYALSRNGSYAESIQDCQEALSLIADGRGMDSLRGCAYRYLGMFYGETDEPEKGLHFLALAQESWERSGESPSRMAGLAQTTGLACEKQNRFVAAIKEYARALDIWTSLGNKGGIAEALNGIGVCRHWLGQYRSALDVLRDALPKSQEGGLARVEAYVLTSLGDLYHDLGQFSLALTYYDLG